MDGLKVTDWCKLALPILLIGLSGCEAAPPPAPIAQATAQNGYGVAKVFEHDGCAMYRFKDEGYYRYFATCGKQQQVTEEHNEYCGELIDDILSRVRAEEREQDRATMLWGVDGHIRSMVRDALRGRFYDDRTRDEK